MCVGRCVARLRRNVRRKVVATFSPQAYPSWQGPCRNVRRKVSSQRSSQGPRRNVILASQRMFSSVRYSIHNIYLYNVIYLYAATYILLFTCNIYIYIYVIHDGRKPGKLVGKIQDKGSRILDASWIWNPVSRIQDS